jgi:hypothetical protein
VLVFELPDHPQHLRDVVGGARLVRRALDAQRVEIAVHARDHAIGELAHGLAVLDGAPNDLVVDVGDVAHERHAQTAGPEPTLHQVERDVRARMADVAIVVDRDAAYIHAHMARLDRGKILQGARQGVVDAQAHEGWVDAVFFQCVARPARVRDRLDLRYVTGPSRANPAATIQRSI